MEHSGAVVNEVNRGGSPCTVDTSAQARCSFWDGTHAQEQAVQAGGQRLYGSI